MSSQQETASYGGYAKDRSALAGLGEALLDALDDHSTDTQWGQWLQAPYEAAATAGDAPLATALFKAGVAGDHLHPAIRADQGQLVKELLRLGASPTAKDNQGDAPIHVAASLGRADIIADIIETLKLKNGGEEAVREEQEDGRGRTPLHLACWKGHAAAVEVLLDVYSSREDVRRRLGETGIGFTAFDLADRGNHDGVKDALLARWPEERASWTSVNSADGAILLEASEQNNVPMIEFLVVEAGVDVNFKDGRGLAPLHSAALKGACQAMSALMKHGADPSALDDAAGVTPLHYAAQGGHVAAIDVLCAAGVDVNLRVERYLGYCPEEDTSSALDSAAMAGSVDALKALLRHGADWKALSREGMAVMNSAAAGNQPAIIDLLVELGARVDTQDDFTQPLFTATTANAPDAVRALLRHGADLNIGVLSQTLLEDAMLWHRNDVIEVMLEHGVDPNFVGDDGTTLLQSMFESTLSLDALGAIVRRGADVTSPNDEGEYPLHQTARCVGGSAAVELLIEAGADPNSATAAGLTPLLIACSKGDGHAADALLRHGASMDVVDEQGNSPLHLAAVGEGCPPWQHHRVPGGPGDDGNASAARGDPLRSCVEVVLRAGADERTVNGEDHTPADKLRLELASKPYTRATAERVLERLARVPNDRAWRRRALWVMCRLYPDRVKFRAEASRAKLARVDEGDTAAADGDGGGGEETGGARDGARADDVDRVAARVLGLHEEGLFRHVVGFL